MIQTALVSDEQDMPVGVKVDVSYGMITLGGTTVWSVLSGWLLYFYLPPEKPALAPAALYGIAPLIASIVSVAISLPIGYWSDHVRGRWGRRLPFIFVSSLPMLAFFVLLWVPPVRTQSLWNLAYLTSMLVLYHIAYSVNQIPYEALLPELVSTDHHRVRMSAWYAGFQLVGMILGGFAGLAIGWLGYPGTALFYAVVMVPFFYLPFLVLRERTCRQIAPAGRLGFGPSIKATLDNRAFLIFVAAWAFYWGTMTLVQSAIPFVATEICLLEPVDTAYFYIPAVIAALLCYPFVTWLSDRIGKRRVFSWSLLASAIMLAGLLLIGDWLPVPLKIQGIAWAVLEAMAMSGVTVLTSALAAEVTDHDQSLTGQRREGAYYSAMGLLDHVITGVASALLPILLLLGRSHTAAHGPLGVRLIGALGGLMMLVAFVIFLRYPLGHSDK